MFAPRLPLSYPPTVPRLQLYQLLDRLLLPRAEEGEGGQSIQARTLVSCRRERFEGGEGPSRTRPLERRGEEGVDKDRKVGEPRPRRGGQEARDPRLLQMGELRAQGGSGDGHPPVHTVQGQHVRAWQFFLVYQCGNYSPLLLVWWCVGRALARKTPPTSRVLSAIPMLCQCALASMWLQV